MPTNAAPAAPRAGLKQWFGLVMLLLPTALMTADLGVLWLATPYLTADLQPTSSQLLWVTDSYGFMTAGFLVIMGTLGDRIGRRKLLMIGSVLFIAASVIAAYAPSALVLIIGRGLLGIAGAAVLPSTLSLITTMFVDARQRGAAIAAWVTALSLGLGVGPVLGGVLLGSFWWGSVFLIAVPVMVLALVTAPVLLPEYRDPAAGRLDLLSVLLFLLGILPVVYAIKHAAESGVDVAFGVALVVGLVFGTLFVRRQRALPNPLIDVRLFANRTFTMALVTLMLGMMALNGVEYVVPQLLQLVSGMSPMDAALWLLPSAAGLMLGSQLTPPLTRTFRPAYVIGGGQVVALVGYAMIWATGEGYGGGVLASVGLTVVMFGVAPISVLCTGIAVGSAPAEKAGVAAGTGQTSYELGLALGIAVVGSVSVAVYRSDVADRLPAGLPEDAVAQVRDTLGSAVAVSETLPGAQGAEVAAVARAAFLDGFHASAIFSGAVALVLTVLVVTLLRHVPSTPRATEPAEPTEPGPSAEAVGPAAPAAAVEPVPNAADEDAADEGAAGDPPRAQAPAADPEGSAADERERVERV
ncbi:MFS transporter [Saccharothrix australiensis]|uniref:DHA2 family multidrug resistance protein-like MFS transporter n=1 Tax=Saccharothrix australiensis TaxID=2072 RepID=A0A495W1F8_9PSEU|nr:MFS transporter [Saccharothrix australiensis]RKT54545.1 DHA2 family multidrug resistance protein-like MFS transporter [Saccharothrix australiensis]